MDKNESVEYINRIKPYINLSAICKLYNENTQDVIDYNNLRAVLNGTSKTRLSESKLRNFIKFVYNFLYPQIFKVYNTSFLLKDNIVENIIKKHFENMSDEIIGELTIEFSNKRKQ